MAGFPTVVENMGELLPMGGGAFQNLVGEHGGGGGAELKCCRKINVKEFI